VFCLGKLLSLERIDNDVNYFTGEIPDSFFDAIKLKFIDSKKLSFCEGQESAHKRMKWFSNEL